MVFDFNEVYRNSHVNVGLNFTHAKTNRRPLGLCRFSTVGYHNRCQLYCVVKM